jgi:hypothetical protein
MQLLITEQNHGTKKNSAVKVASMIKLQKRTWYVSSEVVLGVGLAPVDGGPGSAAAERGEQHLRLELPQRERVGGVEELAEEERAEQGPLQEHGGPRGGVRAGSLLQERVLQQRHAPLGRCVAAGLQPNLERPTPRHRCCPLAYAARAPRAGRWFIARRWRWKRRWWSWPWGKQRMGGAIPFGVGSM